MLTRHYPITAFAIPGFAAAILAEVTYLSRRKGGDNTGAKQRTERLHVSAMRGYHLRDTLASLTMGVVSLFVGIAIAAVDVPISLWAYHHRLTNLGSGPVAWAAAVVAWDFAYYWYHRASHRMELLWANHVQHHSSRFYNYSTALRQPVTSFSEWLFFPVLAATGVAPWIVFAAGSINLLYQFWIHTEMIDRLPRAVEYIFNTPSHHRVHHGTNGQYLDRNYGGILIVWDRLFGTYEEEIEPVTYGLVHDIDTFNPLRIATHEYVTMARSIRSSRHLTEKVLVPFRPPGWAWERNAASA